MMNYEPLVAVRGNKRDMDGMSEMLKGRGNGN